MDEKRQREEAIIEQKRQEEELAAKELLRKQRQASVLTQNNGNVALQLEKCNLSAISGDFGTEIEKDLETDRKSKLSFAIDQLMTDRTNENASAELEVVQEQRQEMTSPINFKNEKTPRKTNNDRSSRNNEVSRTLTAGSRSHTTTDGHKREIYTEKQKCDGNVWNHTWT